MVTFDLGAKRSGLRAKAEIVLEPVADRVADPPLTAPILPTLVRFALPNMGAMLATALAAIAETTYVGRQR
jgi:hypothetical protein